MQQFPRGPRPRERVGGLLEEETAAAGFPGHGRGRRHPGARWESPGGGPGGVCGLTSPRPWRQEPLVEVIREEIAAVLTRRLITVVGHRARRLPRPWPRPWGTSPARRTCTSTTPSPHRDGRFPGMAHDFPGLPLRGRRGLPELPVFSEAGIPGLLRRPDAGRARAPEVL